MSKYSHSVEFSISTKLNDSGIKQLQSLLNQCTVNLAKLEATGKKADGVLSFKESISDIQKLQSALNDAFDSRTGMANISKLKENLSSAGVSMSDLTTSLSRAGNVGNTAMSSLIANVGKANVETKTMSATMEKMFTTMQNTVRWGISASAFQAIEQSLSNSVQYIQDLDKSLNDIRIVSDYSAQDMKEFAAYANQAAQSLGTTTTDFTNASLIYAQQGYDLDTSNQLSTITSKMAAVTGQSTEAASEEITSIMNGYQMNITELEGAIDSLANVAALGASDMEELATAESKVAATASTLGVTQDQLAAQISTIISVTREAPETVGNSLKTIYDRITDLKLGETLEDGVSLGDLSGELDSIGVQVLDDAGDLRSVGDILEDLMVKWQDLSTAQKQALAVDLAGKYQSNNLMTLMENMEMYNQQLGIATDSEGTLDKQHAIYMESMAAKLASLQAAWEDVISSMVDNDVFNPAIDALTNILNLFNNIIDTVGGGTPILNMFTSLILKANSTSIGERLYKSVKDRTNPVSSEDEKKQFLSNVDVSGNSPEVQRFKDTVDKSFANRDTMTNEQKASLNASLDEYARALQTLDQEKQKLQEIENANAKIIEQNSTKVAQAQQELDKANQNLAAQQSLLKTATANVKSSGLSSGKEELSSIYAGKDSALSSQAKKNLKLSSAKGQVAKAIDNFNDASTVEETAAAYDKLKASMENLSSVSTDLRMDNSILDGDFEAIQATITELEKKLADYENRLDSVRQAESEVSSAANGLQSAEAGKDVTGNEAATAEQRQRVDNAGRQVESLDTGLNQGVDDAAAQARYQNLVSMTGAVTDLIFAWQSFQSLGSIWAQSEDDVSFGEKLASTFTSILLVAPQLITSLKTLKDVAKSNDLADVAKDLSTMSAKFSAAAAASSGFGIANQAAAAGTGFLSVAVGKLGTVLAAVAPYLTIITLAVGAVSAVTSAALEANEQKLEDAKDAADEAISTYSSISDSLSSFDGLYKEYQETGEVTDSFKESCESAAEALNIAGADALIAAGNYSELADRISEADEKQRSIAKNAVGGELATLQSDSLNGGWLQQGVLYNGSASNDLADALKKNSEKVSAGKNSSNHGDSIYQDTVDSIRNMDIGDAVGTIRKQISDYNSQIEDLDAEIKQTKLDGGDTTELEAKRTELQGYLSNLQNTLTEEGSDIAEWIDKAGQYSQYIAQDLNANGDLEGLDYQGIVDKFFNSDSTMTQYLESLGSWSEQLQWMIDNTTDESAKLKLQLEQAKESFSSNLSTSLDSSLSTNNIDYNTLVTGGTVSQEEYSKQVSQSMLDQIANSGLTESEQLDFIAGIDWSKSLDQIQADIDSINSSGELPTLSFEAEANMTDRSSFSDDDISDLLDDTGMSENAFNRMTSDTFNSGEFADAANEIKDSIKALEDSGDTSEETADKIADLRQEYEDLGDSAKDVSAYNLQMNKGVKKLVDSWEDLSDVLSDDAAKGTSDYYEAIGELDDAMSDILNIDTGVLSNGFYENADALDAMQRAAEGDESAIDDLRTLAAQDIIMNLDVQGITAEDKDYLINNELLPMLSDFQAQLDNAPLGMQVDVTTDPFIQKLNQLLMDSQITAEQASNILSSVGMDAEISEVKDTIHQTHSAQYPRFKVETNENGIMTGIVPDGVETVTWESDDEVSYPSIQGATYTGSGFQTVGSSSSGNSGKKSSGGSGGSGGKGSGGSGSGSGSSYTPKKKDKNEDEIDRYEKVDTVLDSLGNDLEKIADEQDRLTGKELAKNMAEQAANLKEQVKWQQQKLDIEKQEAQEIKNNLANNYGVTFDSSGYISNYEERWNAYHNNINSLTEQYNAATDEATQESLSDQIDAAQDAFDKFNDYVDRYDELISDTIKGTEKEIEELYDEIEDLQIEAFQKAVDSTDNLKELSEELIDFNNTLDHFGEESGLRDFESSSAKLAQYWDTGTKSMKSYYAQQAAQAKKAAQQEGISDEKKKWYLSQADMYTNLGNNYDAGTDSTLGWFDQRFANMQAISEQIRQYEETGTSSIFGENGAELYDTAKEIYEAAIDEVKEYEEEWQNARDAMFDIIDEMNDKLDAQLEKYENINDELEHYKSMAELLGATGVNIGTYTDAAKYREADDVVKQLKEEQAAVEEGSTAWEYYEQQIGMAEAVRDQYWQEGDGTNTVVDAQNAASQAIVDNNTAQISVMRQSVEELTKLRDSLDEGSEEWEEVNEKLVETQDELLSKTEDTIQELQDIYDRTNQQALDNFVENLLGTTLDEANYQWELLTKNTGDYLDDVESAYQIQKLQNKYRDLLDNTNDLYTQQKITAQMNEQLDMLREKGTLSQYEVDYANAQLEILQKQIALEDAQRNKSQLKLRRDTQGNYSYVYEADEGDVTSAEDSLADATYNAYELSKENKTNLQESYLQAIQDFYNRIQQINENDNWTEDRKLEERKAAYEEFKNDTQIIAEQLAETNSNLISDFSAMAELLVNNSSDNMKETYANIVAGNTEAFDQIDDTFSTFLTKTIENDDILGDAYTKMTDTMTKAGDDYVSGLKKVASEAETQFGDIAKAVEKPKEATAELKTQTDAFINSLKEMSGQVVKAEDTIDMYRSKIEDANNSLRAYQQQVNTLETQLTEKENENSKLQTEIEDLKKQLEEKAAKEAASSSSGSGSGGGGGGGGSDWNRLADEIIEGYWGNNPTRQAAITAKYGWDAWAAAQNEVNRRLGSSYRYDSGGYTGEWNDDGTLAGDGGKIAFLHQKELVLNQDDTANMLAAVEALRSMTTNYRNGAFENLVSAINQYGSEMLAATGSSGQDIEQHVTIEANFPSVNSRQEIEDAFNGLIERAQQYAYRD